MKIHIQTALCLTMAFVIVSCGTPRTKGIRYINDQIKGNRILLWNHNAPKNSTIDREYRLFEMKFIKEINVTGEMKIEVVSNFPSTRHDYQDTAYLLASGRPALAVPFTMVKNISYKEQNNTITATTTTKTDLKTTNTKTTTGNTSLRDDQKKVETDVSTETTTRSDTDTKVNSEILDKVSSRRQLFLNGEAYDLITQYITYKIRIYKTDGDYWDLEFREPETFKIKMMGKNQYTTK